MEAGTTSLYLKFGSSNDVIQDSTGKLIEVHSLKIYNGEPIPENFIKLITPEIILIWYYRQIVYCQIKGDIAPFMNYKVHYIGTATKQKIVDRLLSHTTFQRILSEVDSITSQTPPSNEIVLLFFEIDGASNYSFFVPGDVSPLDIEFFMGNGLPSDIQVFTEAEKVFVKCFRPNYNQIRFKSYPRKEDLMSSQDFIFMAYSIEDPLILIFDNGYLNALNQDSLLLPKIMILLLLT